jgi:hypothetical protein
MVQGGLKARHLSPIRILGLDTLGGHCCGEQKQK